MSAFVIKSMLNLTVSIDDDRGEIVISQETGDENIGLVEIRIRPEQIDILIDWLLQANAAAQPEPSTDDQRPRVSILPP